MGVKNLAIAVNKMDAVEYKEDTFKKVKEEVSKLLKQVGINPDTTPFLAVAGLKGDNIGINLRGIGKKDIARGDVICDASKPISIVEEFIAQIAVINHPTVLAKGYTPVFHIHTAQVPCQFVELIAQMDPKTGGVLKEHPDFLKNGDVAKVRIKPMGKLALETSKENPYMSRFAVRDAGSTVAAGVCLEITKKK